MKYILAVLLFGFAQSAMAGYWAGCTLRDLTTGAESIVIQDSNQSLVVLNTDFKGTAGIFKVSGRIFFYGDYDDSYGNVDATIQYVNGTATIGKLSGGIGLYKSPSLTIYDTSPNGDGKEIASFSCHFSRTY